ncbi:inorganic pyrophosphatase [endosymbiont of Euscepes postfasciatus]|uniref:inorganic diphosphatase n=1 Tax=endosymbiont of Euscepes postfasciatus TaxID=650377 RepID=UPI000DC6EF75|nr:inorganic diphosphatase [endosymbiont of Euscepes postfasciatus]BBA84585.1 inorganic pyrophosphatase [endosymbiont of Euscepes postfasciatus]
MNKKSINNTKDFYVTIEIPKGNFVKYEINKKNNNIYVDRFINAPIPYPFNYGYINNTLSLDNDYLDSVIISKYKIYPNSIMLCRSIGMLLMEDESGIDNKIICVPSNNISKDYKNINNIYDISNNYLNKIKFFFKYYKKMDSNKWSKIICFKDKKESYKEIFNSIERFKKNK